MTQPSEILGDPASGSSAPIPGSATIAGQSPNNNGNFLTFFNLRRNPFSISPDPRDLFWTPQTQQALSDLTTGLQAGKNLIVLSGEPGTGKTTLINHLLSSLREREVPVAFVFNSHLDIDNLFDFILADFSIPEDPSRPRNLRRSLHDWLYARHRSGQHPVLIVDEAQGLTAPVLEEIRMLLNLEIEGEKLIQIILSGQPELDALLATPQLLQLRQRVALRCRTAPLTVAEAHEYIERRLALGGAEAGKIFPPETLNAIYFYSGGTLRVINLLCEQSLMRAHRERMLPVTPQIVEAVAREFQFDDFKPFPRSVDFLLPAVAEIRPASSSSFTTSPTKSRMLAMAARASHSNSQSQSQSQPQSEFNAAPAPAGILRAREQASVTSIAEAAAPSATIASTTKIASPATTPTPVAAVPVQIAPEVPAPVAAPAVAPPAAVASSGTEPVAAPAPEVAAEIPAPAAAPPPAKFTPLPQPAPAPPHEASTTPPLTKRLANALTPATQKLQSLYANSVRWLTQPMPTTNHKRPK